MPAAEVALRILELDGLSSGAAPPGLLAEPDEPGLLIGQAGVLHLQLAAA